MLALIRFFFEEGKVPVLNWAPHHEDVCWSGDIVPPFLILALDGGEWSASRPGHFTPGERAPNPLDWWLGGPQNRSGRCIVEKNISPLPEIEPRPSNPSLYRLSYLGSFERSQ
jgi:hypothetical protein